ncbi:YraN family protein [Dysgonomonas sp. 511]|uniref:YraN family protein n=1 Tax=Dysgonomonas sp. 511 TaxID=2302930 RepID=UPI0013D541AD|nr:YraN family protein [Dysgonomonas sp. 511]NDV77794.1 YraN family protein [Dysgonomonas sp. 511]
MAEHNDLGQKGESAATNYLEQNGYRIIERNWTYGKYEIDIIAANNEFLVFAEVKTRSSSYWGNPEEAVSKKKIKYIVEAADYYIKENDIEQPVRFDVIAAIWNGKTFEIEHIDDAFLAPVN